LSFYLLFDNQNTLPTTFMLVPIMNQARQSTMYHYSLSFWVLLLACLWFLRWFLPKSFFLNYLLLKGFQRTFQLFHNKQWKLFNNKMCHWTNNPRKWWNAKTIKNSHKKPFLRNFFSLFIYNLMNRNPFQSLLGWCQANPIA